MIQDTDSTWSWYQHHLQTIETSNLRPQSRPPESETLREGPAIQGLVSIKDTQNQTVVKAVKTDFIQSLLPGEERADPIPICAEVTRHFKGGRGVSRGSVESGK